MSKLLGVYKQQKAENLDTYYAALGVPYLARKIMCATSPQLTIENNDNEWTISYVTTFRTLTVKFKLGEPYEEAMPKGALKSTTTVEGETLQTVSIGPKDAKLIRIYQPTETGCVVTFKYGESGVEAKRFFIRA